MEQSDNRVETFIDLKDGTWMFTFNHRRSLRPDGSTTHEFEHSIVVRPDRESAIAALIARRYSTARELALINAKIMSDEGADVVYAEYTSYRVEAKIIVDKSIAGHEEAE